MIPHSVMEKKKKKKILIPTNVAMFVTPNSSDNTEVGELWTLITIVSMSRDHNKQNFWFFFLTQPTSAKELLNEGIKIHSLKKKVGGGGTDCSLIMKIQ